MVFQIIASIAFILIGISIMLFARYLKRRS
jgi:hypothetical protein